jgi:hypothetical protein
MKNTGFSAHISLQLAKHHIATLIKCNKTKKEKPMKMAKFCEYHPPKIFPNHTNFEE